MRLSFIKSKHLLVLAVALLGLLLYMDGCNETDEEETPEDPAPSTLEPKTRREATICREDPSAKDVAGFGKLSPLIQDFLRYKHCKDFSQILDEPLKCGGRAKSDGVFLLFAIKSSPENFERRVVLRQTWAEERSYGGAHVKRIFLSGTSRNQHGDKRLRKLLQIESAKFGDVLQWDFQDSFFNLTVKQWLFHRWFSEHCPGARFVMNGDDDVFVNTFNVIAYLRDKRPNEHLFVGQMIANVKPIRDPGSKYYVPVQVYPSNSYPNYVAGGGILMSGYTAHVIHNESQEIPLIPIDDVYLGMCLTKAGLAPASHNAMTTVGLASPSKKVNTFDPCFYRQILMVHRFVPSEMMVMWNAVQDPHLNCGQQVTLYNH